MLVTLVSTDAKEKTCRDVEGRLRGWRMPIFGDLVSGVFNEWAESC